MSGATGLGRRRLVAVAAAGVGVYGTAAYAAYMYAALRRQGEGAAPTGAGDGAAASGSHVASPLRARAFDRLADTYDAAIGRDERAMGINLLRRWMLYWHARGTVLEVGAGTGRNIDYYPKSVDRVLLMDRSAEMLQQAEAKVQRRRREEGGAEAPRFALLRGDATTLRTDTLALPDGAFDTVVDTFGLCSYDDPLAVLRQMARVCRRPDGRILLLEHGRSHSWELVSRYLDAHAERHAAAWGCVWNRDLDALLAAAEREGFLRVERRATWHFGTTYYVVCRPQ